MDGVVHLRDSWHAIDGWRPALASISFNLTVLDVLVIAVPLLLAFTVTLYMKRYTRGVADYLAASRTAGRYLISTAQMELGITAVGVVTAMEVFSQTGFSLNLWQGFIGFFWFILAMSGVVNYRFRETRALTFHQFFEIRFSKGLRVFATFLNVFSGLFSFGIGPGIAARFFVYYLGLDPAMQVAGMVIPTFAVVMVALMAVTLYFTFVGGQLTVMTTDCIEGVISSFLYLVVAIAILCIFSYDQMGTAMCSGAAGASYVDPFDIGATGRANFSYSFLILMWLMGMYYWRGNAWNAGFSASAKSAHEGQMAVILGVWRGMGATAMGGLIGLGAFTLLHNPEFAAMREQVASHLETTIPASEVQLRTQLLLPTALGVLLPAGVKGAFCAVLLMGVIAGMSSALQGFSSGLIQDVILPFRRKQLVPKAHIRLLRLAAIGVVLFGLVFSLLYKIPDYLVFAMQLIGGLYLAGIGAVVWGGLYWKRATNQGAWAAMTAGSLGSLAGMALQQWWPPLAHWLLQVFTSGALHNWVAGSYPSDGGEPRFPLNGQVLTGIVIGISLGLFVIVSLLTCRQPYDLDKLLHRGKYRVEGEHKAAVISNRFHLGSLAGVNENFTRGDRVLAYFTFFWGLLPNIVGIAVVAWNLGYYRWSPQGWWAYWHFWSVSYPIVGGVITTIWFTWGVSRDLLNLMRDLRTIPLDANDNGQVRPDDPPSSHGDVQVAVSSVPAQADR